jgi:hypothetical protein
VSTHDAEYFLQTHRAQGIPARGPFSAPKFPQRATEPPRSEQLPWPRNLSGELASIAELMAEQAHAGENADCACSSGCRKEHKLPAASAASWIARLVCRVEIGSVALRSGNSQPCGNITLRRLPSFHRSRNSASSWRESMALRSLCGFGQTSSHPDGCACRAGRKLAPAGLDALCGFGIVAASASADRPSAAFARGCAGIGLRQRHAKVSGNVPPISYRQLRSPLPRL